jgi:hypothetical protein
VHIICQKGLKKTTKNIRDGSRSHDRELNPNTKQQRDVLFWDAHANKN